MGHYWNNIVEVHVKRNPDDVGYWIYADGILPYGNFTQAAPKAGNAISEIMTIAKDGDTANNTNGNGFWYPDVCERAYHEDLDFDGCIARLRKAFPYQKGFPTDADYLSQIMFRRIVNGVSDEEQHDGSAMWVTMEQLIAEEIAWKKLIEDGFIYEIPYNFRKLIEHLKSRFDPAKGWQYDYGDVRVIIWDEK